MKIIRFEEISSTNEYAKTLVKDKLSLIVTAKKQSGGKGTKGRSFSSEVGGVYLTKLSFYDDFPAKNACLIMSGAAVAVCKTLEFYGLKPQIKWANDVFVEGKKICGILIENGFSGANISYSIVGIGLNVRNEFPVELQRIAISMKEATGRDFSVEEVTKTLIAYLQEEPSAEEYQKRLGFLRTPVWLVEGEKTTKVQAVGVTDGLELIVEEENGIRRLVRAGEVSLKV